MNEEEGKYNHEYIMALLENYANRFLNGDAVRPEKKSKNELEEGDYGAAIAEADSLQSDRSKITTKRLQNISILYEIEARTRAYEMEKEADNIKILGDLYKKRYDKKLLEDMDAIECLKQSLIYYIEALTLEYVDREHDEEYTYAI